MFHDPDLPEPVDILSAPESHQKENKCRSVYCSNIVVMFFKNGHAVSVVVSNLPKQDND